MSLESYISDTGVAKIVSVTVGPIRTEIAEEHWKAWSQYDAKAKASWSGVTPFVAKLDRDHYHITIDDDGFERTEYFIVPMNKRGYNKSGIKEVLVKNGFGPDPTEWSGVIAVVYDKDGYVKIAR